MEKSPLIYWFLLISSLERPSSLDIKKIKPQTQKSSFYHEDLQDFPSFLLKDYERLEEIGQGAQGIVFKVKDRKTEQIKAIKCLKTREPELRAQV